MSRPFRLKLVTPPRIYPGLQGYPPLPSLGSSLLAAKARAAGIEVDQDDLDIKLIHNRPLLEDLTELCQGLASDRLPALCANLLREKSVRKVVARLADESDFNGFDLIGWSLNENSLTPALLLAAYVSAQTGTPAVVGGRISFLYGEALRDYPFITYVVRDFGEIPLVRLVEALQGKTSFEEVPSLLWVTGDGELHSTPKWVFDLEAVPCSDFDGLPLEHFRSIPLHHRSFVNPLRQLILPYKFSYGCQHRCTFCSFSSARSEHALWLKPVERVIRELRHLRERHDTRCFMFLNSSVNVAPRYLGELVEALEEADLDLLWGDAARVAKLTPELVRRLAGVGCRYLNWGVESGSDRVLERMKKLTTCEETVRNLRAAHEAEIVNHLNLIAGFPGETEEDFQATLDVVRAARFAGAFTFQYSPRPGTPAADMPDQVPPDVVGERYRRLVDVVNEIAWEANRDFLGCSVEVLVSEGEGRKDGRTERITGRAADNRLVHVGLPTESSADLVIRPGDMVTARVTYAAPHHLVADEVIDMRPTPAGDAWQARQGAPSAPASPGILLGLPSVRS
jgi:tRNA A37 methylthiotransferase MiaB